jgi:hypothetical protein
VELVPVALVDELAHQLAQLCKLASGQRHQPSLST